MDTSFLANLGLDFVTDVHVVPWVGIAFDGHFALNLESIVWARQYIAVGADVPR